MHTLTDDQSRHYLAINPMCYWNAFEVSACISVCMLLFTQISLDFLFPFDLCVSVCVCVCVCVSVSA